MSTITPTITWDVNDPFWVSIVWASMHAGDVGDAVEAYRWPNQVVQVAGGTGVKLQVCNDGSIWLPLYDFGTSEPDKIVSLETVTGLLERARYLRPRNDGASTVTVTLFASKLLS